MEIKIDTVKDSKEDIKKAIAFLQAVVQVEEHPVQPSIPVVSPSAFSIFSDEDATAPIVESRVLKKKDEKDRPKIEIVDI